MIVKTRSASSRKPAALTIMEMMVAMTLLMIIIVGLTAMFAQTQRAFKQGLRQMENFDSGRTIMDQICADLEKMAIGPNCYITNFYVGPGTSPLVQSNDFGPLRTNRIQEFYCLGRSNNYWLGIGYAVSNRVLTNASYTNGAHAYRIPGTGTLYRYIETTNTTFFNNTNNKLFTNFMQATFNNANFHRLADGVIHLQIRVFTNALDMTNGVVTNVAEVGRWDDPMPLTFPLSSNYGMPMPTNYFYPAPNYIEVELGIVDSETFEQVRAMPTADSITNFLAARPHKVHIFRRQIPIRTAPR